MIPVKLLTIIVPLCLVAILMVEIIFKPAPLNVLGISTVPQKAEYSIAVFGDSMVDTMGENLEYLQIAMKSRYPNTTIRYYNYGIGSQNVVDGFARFKIPFNYKTRNFDSIPQLRPDIIIVGSFAYNIFTPHDKIKHWLALWNLVQEAKNTGSDVYMLAEIAPLKVGFGKGPGGVNWAEDNAHQHAGKITEQLENAVYLARDHLKVPLINAYSATKVDGKFGAKRFVDPNDGIHPSIEGHGLMAEMIAATIKLR